MGISGGHGTWRYHQLADEAAVLQKLKKLQIARCSVSKRFIVLNDEAASLSGAGGTFAPPAGSLFFPGSDVNPGIFSDFGRLNSG
jgi:hypothetical protein